MTPQERKVIELALNALKELVAQNENRYWAIKHDHFAMKDARYAIARAREALAPIEIEKELALEKKAENARELGLNYEPENTLHWHALNYRTAPTQNAQAMFDALEKFVEKAIKEALAQQSPQRSEDTKERSDWNEQVDEPVAWMASDDPSAIESSPPHPELIHQWIPLYTHPPVPWTEKQIKEYAQQQRAQMPEAPL